MEKDEFMKKMENLDKPDMVSESHRRQLRLTLLDTQRSATFGVFLVIAPFLFAMGAIFRHELGIDKVLFTWFFDFIAGIDPGSDSSVLSWAIRFVLVGGPVVAIVVNLLAVMHFQYDSAARELQVALKLKWLNIIVILFCFSIFMIFFIYLLLENINHP